MIDIHSHILPSVDDGAESLELSLKMAQVAVADGVTDMIVTPHCNIPKIFDNYESATLLEYFNMLKSQLRKNDIPLNLYRGMEVYATEKIFDLYTTERIITLNDSRYLLVEFNFDENPDWVLYCLEQLLDLGVTPIVAHPERYNFVNDFPNMPFHWTKMGCLSQINRGSLMEKFGKDAMRLAVAMIDKNLAHFVASDAHSFDRRSPMLSIGYAIIEKNWSKEMAEKLLIKNPRAVIEDRKIIIDEPKPIV